LAIKDMQVRKVLAELDCAGGAAVEEVLKKALKILDEMKTGRHGCLPRLLL
jgi:hypothetical protein